MTDGSFCSPEVNLALQDTMRHPVSQDPVRDLASQGDALRSKDGLKAKEGVAFYRSEHFSVFVPQKPKIPLNEGLHVQVSSGHDSSDSPKEVLARYLMAEGAAKIIAESGKTPDAWANTRLEEGQVVSAYGRVPGVEESWRKPVDTLNRSAPEISDLGSNYDTQKLQNLSARYLSRWEKLAESMELFRNGVNGKDVSEVTKDVATIWENEKIKLEVIINPHLKGLHLMVSPKESFQRQWQTTKPIMVTDLESNQAVNVAQQTYIQQTLEVTAVAMGVQKLLAEGKGELHNSGNWAGGLKSTEEGGKLDLSSLAKNRKAEKKLHRPDIAMPENKINTGMHTHIYLPESGSVILPEMSRDEAVQKGREDVVKQWDAIPSANGAQLEEIRIKLSGGKLTKWLEDNCKGKLISKAA